MKDNKYELINTNIHKIKLHLSAKKRRAKKFDLVRKVREHFTEEVATEM